MPSLISTFVRFLRSLATNGSKEDRWKLYLILSTVLIVVYAISRSVYLLFFHPLSKFPGPKLAAVSNIWYAYHWFSGRYPWAVEKAFEKYGDVVRVAPNEVAFFTPQAQIDILMSGTKERPTFVKSKDFLDIGGEFEGIAEIVDVAKHRAVRKTLSPAFNPRALKEQEPTLHMHVDDFVARLEQQGATNRGVNISEWFDWIACDIAGEMSYGHNFGNVKTAKNHLFLSSFKGISVWGTLSQVMRRFPLLYPLVFLALPPKLATVLPALLRMNLEIVKDRVSKRHDPPHPDYMSHLIPDDKYNSHPRADKPVPPDAFLVAQANHLFVGGFDPDTNLFTSAVYYLLTNPWYLQKLREELRTEFESYEEIADSRLSQLPWLHAVIEESLRCHTNGAFGLPRVSPGDTVDGHYIPKGIRVQTAAFATTHSKRYFLYPREFHPERFLPTTHPDYNSRFDYDNKPAFKPFGLGSRGCIGREMGYLIARILLGKMVWKLEWEHLNKDQVDWERDCRLYAIWEKPAVVVKFTSRTMDQQSDRSAEKVLKYTGLRRQTEVWTASGEKAKEAAAV